ncbi:hypothetical protein FKZ61_014750 [Litorilinea aerophila]|uniref:Uncharacterized protein n=1 Tax=Litorilinea aerophila TaxID=1204385 RepID=A0A540VFF4_9CHLR|nr:hypothetical protein [Litorilinea aerophila]MCC9077362.1 hypothetical protein [Litorilinea aerophila]OUC08286.1 hypothetical protein RY27_09875 [Litorilinea aerophila]GIV76236.1 MAG: hypothetical protein KatS3mg050_0630 [Litorilinea sp.]
MTSRSSNPNANREPDPRQEAGGPETAAGSQETPPYEPPPRRPASQRENAFNLLAWLAEGATGVLEELRHNDLGLSEEFWVHAYAARREALLAARALIDSLLEKTEKPVRQAQERAERRRRRGDIRIDF